jgi:anhydro-N-acetylmuramic acid kinase
VAICVPSSETVVSADRLADLLALRQLSSRRIVGLMSGTSADGVDAALVEVFGHGRDTQARLVAFDTITFTAELKHRIWELPDGRSENICELNFLIGEAFAEAARAVVARAGLLLEEVHLVGSHGQTARHQPPDVRRGSGSTLQIGEGAVIAERTGLPVISDFRVADVAAGGHGAPLIPLVDYLLLGEPRRTRATLNLGGIANVAVIPPRQEHLVAFDIGPANMALDAVARAASGGTRSYDRGGAMGAAGRVDEDLLAELLELPFLAQAPPKSTGREMFGRHFIYPLIDRYAGRLADLLATLTLFTAEAIGRAFDEHILSRGPVDELLVSGGGVHNRLLMNQITQRLAPLRVVSSIEAGIDPDAKEALGFAILANQSIHAEPGNVPHATGASGPRVLGKISLPPP